MRKIFFLVVATLMLTACNNQTQTTMKENNTEPVLGLGEVVTDNFTGKAWLKYLSTHPETTDCLIYNVTFAPATRNYWHTHSEGQILICTEGEGYYQERGRTKQLLKSGDVVHIPAATEHWHGATPNRQFTHIGITPKASVNQVQWIGEVTDEEYNNAIK
ncbi:MAG: cupin domain-containing protein [Flavobacteriales bacterium]|nr:cupin domain-containing protein [Flavobacteriales bacterium]